MFADPQEVELNLFCLFLYFYLCSPVEKHDYMKHRCNRLSMKLSQLPSAPSGVQRDFRKLVDPLLGWVSAALADWAVSLWRCRLLSSGSLRKLLAGWNHVSQLPERLESSQLEVLDLQHNRLTELPHNLFIKAQR